jgi:CRP/FNR family cyclic AMP-dependent transcriptional regulator
VTVSALAARAAADKIERRARWRAVEKSAAVAGLENTFLKIGVEANPRDPRGVTRNPGTYFFRPAAGSVRNRTQLKGLGSTSPRRLPASIGNREHVLPPFRESTMNDSHKLIVRVQAGRTTDNYRKHEKIFVQGEIAESVFFIQKGRVKISVFSAHGREAVIGIMDEGQFFGEGCLQDQRLRPATATALNECRITSISKAAMFSAIRDEPKFSKVFLDHLLNRNSRLQEDVVDQLFNSSEKRLARLLLLLANYGKEGSPPIIPVILNQETLAEMIGTTRSRVSFFMNKFRSLGFIDYDGIIHVHPSLLASVLHDKPEVRQENDSMRKVRSPLASLAD